MFMRALGSTLILSGVVASAIALAQNPDKLGDTKDQPPPTEVDLSDAAVLQPLTTQVLPRTTYTEVQSTPRVYTVPPGSTRALSPEEQKQAVEFRKAVETLRRADTTEAKAAAREHVTEMVGAQLERDLQVREKKLAEIEARAKELRDQLEQRRSSKAEIQKMLMLLIESPESGFGLPPEWIGSLIISRAAETGYYNTYTPIYPPAGLPSHAATRPTAPLAPQPTLPESLPVNSSK